MSHAGFMDILHDCVQAIIHFFPGPVQAHAVLAHFQAAGGHAAGIGGLAGAEQYIAFLEHMDRIRI